MKSIFAALVLIVGFSTGLSVSAQELSVAVGLRGDSADSESAGFDVSGKSNFQAGGIVRAPVTENVKARLGAMFTRRGYTVKNASNALVYEPDLSYFDFPFGLQFDFNESFSGFFGGDLALNIAKEHASSVNTLPVFGQLGGVFHVTSFLGVEAYYEQGFSKIASEVKNPKAFVGQLFFTF